MRDLVRHEPDGSLRSLHASVVDILGTAISAGELPSGSVVRGEQLEERYGVSRSVVREALGVLASMGMVKSTQRVGVRILPCSEWNLYDPQVIRWRLASRGRGAQLRSLTELRTAVEPEAARLAAVRAPAQAASELMGLAGKLWAAGQAGDMDSFLELDIHFHDMILKASGNEMFGKLSSLVAEVLTGRTHYGLMPQRPHKEALQLHMDVATSIQRGSAVDAHGAMRGIMERALAEMGSIWAPEGTEGLELVNPN